MAEHKIKISNKQHPELHLWPEVVLPPPEANRKQDQKRFLTNPLITNTKLRKK